MTVSEVQDEDKQPTTALATATPTSVDAATALLLDETFAGKVQLSGGDTGGMRRMSWLTGNSSRFAMDGKTPMTPGRGFCIDQPDSEELYPVDYELIDAMELLCDQGIAEACLVEHPVTGAKPRKVASWVLERASFFVICEGVPTQAEMRDIDVRWGVAYGWNAGKSTLRFRAFIKELLDLGCNMLFTVSFNGYCTDKALQALRAQEYVLQFADKLRRGAKEELPPAPFYAYALPIQCSAKTITAGSAKTTEIYYPVPSVPRLSVRELESPLTYLAEQAITHDQALLLEEGDRITSTVQWSLEISKKITAGVAETNGDAEIDDEHPF